MFGVLLHEGRNEAVEQAQHVVAHEHLAVAMRTGADADRRNVERGARRLRDLFGNRLEHDREGAGILQCERVGDERIRVLRASGLLDVAANLVHRLRLQSEVSHHRDADVHHPAHGIEHRTSTLELDGGGSALLEQPARVAHGLFDADLIREERHVGHDERARGAPHDGARVMEHVVERHGERVLVAEHDHAHRVADQDARPRRLVQQARHRRVVGGQHGDLLAARLLLLEIGNANPGGAHDVRRLHRIDANVFFSQSLIAIVTSLLTLRSASVPYSLTSPVMAGTSRWFTPRTTTTSTDFDLLSLRARSDRRSTCSTGT